ncbi:hypothetical protein Tco_1155047 [Tanacetum coccineum]
MSSSQNSSYDYSRKHRMSIIDTWRHKILLPPSPPLSQNASPSLSPRDTNSPSQSPSSPSQNPLRDQMVNEINELHHLSNLIDINLQHAINVSNQTPLSLASPPPHHHFAIRYS